MWLYHLTELLFTSASGITFQAFIDHCSAQHSLRNVDQEFAEAFRIYDRRGQGSLSREDVSYVMTKLGMKDLNLDKLMDEADTDKNNTIEYDGRFLRQFTSLHAYVNRPAYNSEREQCHLSDAIIPSFIQQIATTDPYHIFIFGTR